LVEKNRSRSHRRSFVKSIFPVLQWLPAYNKTWLRPDLLAGITVAAFTVPEAMAYASLAGLPPQAGLYAAFLASIIYVIFGTSRQLAIGPTSAISILVAGTLSLLIVDSPEQYWAFAAMTAILVGIIALVAWVLRLGFIVNFISKPVLGGFTAGAALVIAASQLPKLFGIEGTHGEFFERVWHIIQHLGDTNLPTLVIGLVSIVLLIIGHKKFPRLPTSLVVVLLGILLMSVTNLSDRGVAIVGDIPQGLPAFGIPEFTLSDIGELLPLALAVFILAYVEGMAMVRTFANKRQYRADANQELLALGAANIASGLGQGYAVGGSMSRSAVNDNSGAKTPLAGGIAGLLIIMVVLFLTGLFSKLPDPILAAVVLIAVRSLIDIPELKRIYRINKREFVIAMVAFGGVLIFGLLYGVLIAVFVSIIYMIARVMHPHTAILGRIPGTDLYGDVKRHPENEQVPGILVYRVDSSIFFANAATVHDQISDLIDKMDPPVDLVVLVLEATPLLDITGADMLADIHRQLANRGIALKLAKATGPVRDVLRAEGFEDFMGKIEADATVSKVIKEWQQAKEQEGQS
jgi:high affinity sulfate transporter 1